MSQQQQQQRKKKVEWSSNLSSREPQPSENRSPMWDTESDHMLSYFLGNNGVSSPPTSTQFTTTTSTAAYSGATNRGVPTAPMGSSPSWNTSCFRPPSNDWLTGTSSAAAEKRQDGTSMDDDHDEDDKTHLPPTPVIQHYYQSSSAIASASSKMHFTSASNNFLKSSSLDHSSRVTPGSVSLRTPNFPQSHPPSLGQNGMPLIKHGFLPSGTKAPPTPALENGSPISPAMMIGGDHEPMILPPVDNEASAKSRQSHLEWLRQINALAQASNASTARYAAATQMPATVGDTANSNNAPSQGISQHAHPGYPIESAADVVPQHQQHAPPNAIFPQPCVPIHPAAAAALAAGNPLFFTHAAALLRHQTSSPVETEEKRAKRLERNRESARKSRRRKKERLAKLEGKVNALYNKIELERRVQINSMEKVLGEYATERILELNEEYNNLGDIKRDVCLGQALSHLLSDSVDSSVRKEVVEFQYHSLSNYLLPRYQKFLLWLVLLPDSFYSSAKQEHAKREADNGVPRGTSGKISSKQIGDELTNGRKLDDGRFIPPPPQPAYPQQQQPGVGSGEKNGPAAQAFDATRMWPLICFEMSISVDQEERIINALKRVRDYEHFSKKSSQIAAATRMASGLKEAVRYQMFASSFRTKKTFLDVLTPRQALRYKEWLLCNKERCRQVLDERRRPPATPDSLMTESKSCFEDQSRTLEALCRNLEEILKISKTGDDLVPVHLQS